MVDRSQRIFQKCPGSAEKFREIAVLCFGEPGAAFVLWTIDGIEDGGFV